MFHEHESRESRDKETFVFLLSYPGCNVGRSVIRAVSYALFNSVEWPDKLAQVDYYTHNANFKHWQKILSVTQ